MTTTATPIRTDRRTSRETEERLDVTVILPVYNERGHILTEIARIKQALERSPYTFEILVVDDGSDDGTEALLQDAVGIRLITLPYNRGSGYARRVGTRAALGDVVVWTDADMTYPNDRIPELVSELGDADQVIGARTSEQGTHRYLRMAAKGAIRRLAGYLVGQEIPDLNSGFRAFRRGVSLPYLRLLPDGFSCVTTITLSFMANGHPVRYVPIDYEQRAGRSKFHWRKDTARYLLQIVRMVMSFNPLRVFLPLSLLLLTGAFGKMAFDVVDKSGRITTNAVILTIVSFQLLATGLLADLISTLMGPRE
ncbi:MAG TPA: glycosyltransferase family 2 protein [Nitriliruptorales bacterium]